MTTLACFGDSWAGLSVDALTVLSLEHGFTLDTELIDPSHTALSWLLNDQERLYNHVGSLPADTVWYWSIGGVDTLNGTPAWQLRQFLNQLIELFGGRNILHHGYEWWPSGTGVNGQMVSFYEAALDLDAQHAGYRLVEMRDVVPAAEVDWDAVNLHLSAANYQTRIDHAWRTRLKRLLI